MRSESAHSEAKKEQEKNCSFHWENEQRIEELLLKRGELV